MFACSSSPVRHHLFVSIYIHVHLLPVSAVRRLKAESEGMRSREAWLASEKARLIRLERDEADAVERLAREQAHAAKDLVSARAKQARARQRSAEVIKAPIDSVQCQSGEIGLLQLAGLGLY